MAVRFTLSLPDDLLALLDDDLRREAAAFRDEMVRREVAERDDDRLATSRTPVEV